MYNSHRYMNKILKYAFVNFLILHVFTAYVYAADLRFDYSGLGSGGANFTVEKSDNVRNLYAAGGQLIIDANSSKDTVAAGGAVYINGSTADDLIAAGGNVNVRGNVGGSARVAGGNIVIEKNITEDLVVAGGNVLITSAASVGGDLLVAGGNVTVNGPVRGNIKALAGNLFINNSVNGSIDARVSKILKLGSNARIKGNLNYASPNMLQKERDATVLGTINYTPKFGGQAKLNGIRVLGWIINLLAQLAAGIVLYALFKRKFADLVYEGYSRTGRHILFGLLVLIATPVLALALFLTAIGYYLALVLIFWYILMLMLSWIVGVSVFGVWLKSKISRSPVAVDFAGVILGVVAGSVAAQIPIIGGIFSLIIILLGLGSFLHAHRNSAESA